MKFIRFFNNIGENMTKQQEERMKFLCEEIEKHRHYYYNLNDPIISDKEFDKLFYELEDLEKETGVVLEYSPTKRAGILPISKFNKVKHEYQMYSLDKAQTIGEVEDFIERTEKAAKKSLAYIVEYKFDGISLDIKYEDGKYVQALTRGNGVIGEDVTEQVRTIRTVPMVINYTNTVYVQGEAVMRKSELVKYNKLADEPLKNERNGVSGAIRNLDPKVTASRRLDFVAYSVNKIVGQEFSTQVEVHEFLKANNFYVGDYFKIANGLYDIEKCINEVDGTKKSLDILIDGLVIKANDLDVRKKLGFTDRFPRGQIAYKFDAEEVGTILNDVVWQIGRTGKLTPVAELEAVDIAGVTVKRATLNNMGDIKKKNVKIGSRVLVRRSNEVIPEVMGVLQDMPDSKEIIEPKNCPCCNSLLSQIGANLFCLNHHGCREQIINKLSHFVSKHGMNINGMSESTINLFYDKLHIRTFADIYHINQDDITGLDGFKDRKINNLIESIEKSKNVDLANFIYAIGISGVGRKMARVLAKRYQTYDNLKNATFDELVNMEDIAEISANDILDFFSDQVITNDIDELFAVGIHINEANTPIKKSTGFFTDKKVVLTGTLESFSRDDATRLIEKLGGECLSSVTSNCNLVIAGEKAGSKLDKAKQKGILVLGEAEFIELLKKEGEL